MEFVIGEVLFEVQWMKKRRHLEKAPFLPPQNYPSSLHLTITGPVALPGIPLYLRGEHKTHLWLHAPAL